jgi:hypothetical protein
MLIIHLHEVEGLRMRGRTLPQSYGSKSLVHIRLNFPSAYEY